jgi:hypothetical protein
MTETQHDERSGQVYIVYIDLPLPKEMHQSRGHVPGDSEEYRHVLHNIHNIYNDILYIVYVIYFVYNIGTRRR